MRLLTLLILTSTSGCAVTPQSAKEMSVMELCKSQLTKPSSARVAQAELEERGMQCDWANTRAEVDSDRKKAAVAASMLAIAAVALASQSHSAPAQYAPAATAQSDYDWDWDQFYRNGELIWVCR